MGLEKIDLLGMTLAQLQELCTAEGFPRFAAKQVCDWLYHKHTDSIGGMTNLSLAQRARLDEVAYIGRRSPVRCQVSKDGTKKYLFEVGARSAECGVRSAELSGYGNINHEPRTLNYIEAVYIPEVKNSEHRTPNSEPSRATLCVSSQAGCKMGCHFCATGQQGFHGNLSAAEILNQLFSIPERDSITNIVFMGMGEPMDNLDAVLQATTVLTADWGLGWSPKRITVSTVGIIPQLRRFVEQSQCHLAVSLHNPIAAERGQLMPVERAFPLADVLALLRGYNWSGQRRLSFEYTMFRGLNDDQQHAAALVDALRGLDCRVNLIRFHPSPGMPYGTSSPSAIQSFQNYLMRHGITCTLRASRGQDIDAACGLLAGRAE